MTEPAPRDLSSADARWLFAQERTPALLSFARRLTDVPEVAVDAVSHAVAHANTSPARNEGALFVWLCTLIRHAVVDDVRARGSSRALALLAGMALTVVDDPQVIVATRDEDDWMLRSVVAALTKRERRAFEVLAEGGTVETIATEFGMTPASVNTMLWRTRSKCRRQVARARAGLGLVLPGGGCWRRLGRLRRARLAAVLPSVLVLAVMLMPFVAQLRQHAASERAVSRGAGATLLPDADRPVAATPIVGEPPTLTEKTTGSPQTPATTGYPKPPPPKSPAPLQQIQQIGSPLWMEPATDEDVERTLAQEVAHCLRNALRGSPDPCAHGMS